MGLVSDSDGWYQYRIFADNTPIPSTLYATGNTWINSVMDSKCPTYFALFAPFLRCSCRFPDSDSLSYSPADAVPVSGFIHGNVWSRLGYLYP